MNEIKVEELKKETEGINEEQNNEINENIDRILDDYNSEANNSGEIKEEVEEENDSQIGPDENTSPNVHHLKERKKTKISNEIRQKYLENIKKYFSSSQKNSIPVFEEEGENNLLVFNKLKRLKKKAEVEKEKKIHKKASMSFFDVEAELGSDNEENDDVVKRIIGDEMEEDEEGEEEDLKDLIAQGEENIYEDAETIQEKFFNDMLDRDREEVKKVIHGPQTSQHLNIKRSRSENPNDDEMTLNMRIKKLRSEDDPTVDSEFTLNTLFKSFQSVQKKLEGNDEGENEELSEMYQNMQNQLIRKINEKVKDHRKDLFIRMKENEKILENVINLNSDKKNDDKKQNPFFIKGSQIQQPKTQQNTLPSAKSVPIHHFRGFVNQRNSFLHALKNDKYLPKQESVGDISLQHQNSSDANSNMTTSTNSSAKNSMCPIFHNNKTVVTSTKSSNLSALFTQSTRMRHKELHRSNSTLNETPKLKKLLNE